jgi:hypothetical protein
MRVALLLALVGCYSPAYRDCEITCTGGACPSGYVCDRGVCRVEGFSGLCGASGSNDSGVDSAPNADDDSDGILNKDDNCVSVSNANQANEDRDPRGDACDPCPVDAAVGADNDTDMDGVGDGCDPQPNLRNHITVFEGFNSMAAPANATVVGVWTYAGGQAKSNSGTGMISSITWPELSTNATMVSARYTIDLIDPTSPIVEAGVVHHFQNQGNETRCVLSQAGLQLYRGPTRNMEPTPVTTGQLAVTFSTRINSLYECADAITGLSVVNTYPVASPTRVGFFGGGMNVTLDWVIVVTQDP